MNNLAKAAGMLALSAVGLSLVASNAQAATMEEDENISLNAEENAAVNETTGMDAEANEENTAESADAIMSPRFRWPGYFLPPPSYYRHFYPRYRYYHPPFYRWPYHAPRYGIWPRCDRWGRCVYW
jgi:hypothetical protein